MFKAKLLVLLGRWTKGRESAYHGRLSTMLSSLAVVAVAVLAVAAVVAVLLLIVE